MQRGMWYLGNADEWWVVLTQYGLSVPAPQDSCVKGLVPCLKTGR